MSEQPHERVPPSCDANYDVILPKYAVEIIATVTGPQLRAVLTFKPKTFAAWRIYAFDCLLVDAGLRADEALWLAPSDIDVCSICLVALEDGSDELRC